MRVEWIFSFGAGIEIVGGAFLAFGLISVSPEQAFKRASTFLGWNGAVIVEIAENRANAVAGMIGLATGFAAQMIGYALALVLGWASGSGHTTDAFLSLCFAGVGAVFATPLLRLVRKARLKDYLWHVACFGVDGQPAKAPTPHTANLASYGAEAGFRRKGGEDDAAYVSRIFRQPK